jgi:GNAT superfamily N-acetyltransferase
MIEIRPVTDRRTRRQFIDLPYRLHHGQPHWIPPARITEVPQFDPARNPFFAVADMQLFMAWDGDRPVGRIAAIDDRRHNEVYADNLAAFGFFEAVDAGIASSLLAEVERWAAARGRSAVRGPLNPSLNYIAGLQVDAFDTDPYMLMAWNPPEYVGYVEGAGYAKVKDLYCWLIEPDRVPVERLRGPAERLQKRHNIVVRRLNVRRLRSEVDKLYEVYRSAWQRNWGFVPPTREEFWHISRDLRLLRMLDGVMLAEVDGRPVGCMTAIPDINQVLKGTNGRLLPVGWLRLLRMKHYVTRARAVTAGVIPEYQEKGLGALLTLRFVEVARRYGFKEAEFSWVLDSNPLNTILEKFGGRIYKTYRLYQKAVGNGEAVARDEGRGARG